MPEVTSLRRSKDSLYHNQGVPDHVLLQDLAQGKQSAFEDIYQRYHRLVYAFALKILRDRATTDEVVQDVFCLVWRRARSFNPRKGKFSSWLLAITHNRATDYLRRKDLPLVNPEELDRGDEFWGKLEDQRQSPVRHAVECKVSDKVHQAVAQLPNPAHRQVIELAYFHGLTQEEIAGQMHCPLGTIKSRMKYGMDNLRKVMQQMDLAAIMEL
ncbi:MAG: sigma-70 family RNA polymerase sigma factor [Deinococcus sp.]|nr:sigma-70 family RNA polymerase sigma factor [Deinococcus sp.]